MSRRLVFDTSALVGAALRVGSVPYQALLHAFGACDVCASEQTLTELEKVLERGKFDRYLDRTSRLKFAALIRRNVQLFDVRNIDQAALKPSCRDPRDNQFLALALASEAGVIVSSDEDLLVMHPWHGIRIVTPAAFLSQLEISTSSSE